MIDFLFANWLAIAVVYGLIYGAYVIYHLFAIRFEEKRRVTSYDFSEACGVALISPIVFPCRVVGNALSLAKVSLLAMVNAGLPEEPKKGEK